MTDFCRTVPTHVEHHIGIQEPSTGIGPQAWGGQRLAFPDILVAAIHHYIACTLGDLAIHHSFSGRQMLGEVSVLAPANEDVVLGQNLHVALRAR